MMLEKIDMEAEQVFSDNLGYFSGNKNSSEIPPWEHELLKKMLYCFKVQFSKDMYVTDTTYFMPEDSSGLEL